MYSVQLRVTGLSLKVLSYDKQSIPDKCKLRQVEARRCLDAIVLHYRLLATGT